MRLTKKDKEILRSLVKYHISEVKEDKKNIDKNIGVLFGAEVKYEQALKDLLKKLK